MIRIIISDHEIVTAQRQGGKSAALQIIGVRIAKAGMDPHHPPVGTVSRYYDCVRRLTFFDFLDLGPENGILCIGVDDEITMSYTDETGKPIPAPTAPADLPKPRLEMSKPVLNEPKPADAVRALPTR